MELSYLIYSTYILACFIDMSQGQTTDSSSEYSSKISVYPLNIIIKQGQTLYLTCLNGEAINEFEKIIWVLNGTDLVTDDGQRYKVGNNGNYSLIIWDIDQSHGGYYNCKVMNAEGFHHSPDISVDVLVPSRPTISYEVSEPWIAGEKKNVTFHCKIDNGNNPFMNNVRWYMKWEPFKANNSCSYVDIFGNALDDDPNCQPFTDFSLLMLNDDKWFNAHERYSCQGLNSYGWGELAPYVKFSYSTAPGRAEIYCDFDPVIRGQELTCECIVKDQGYPQSNYRWYRNGELLERANSSVHANVILTPEDHFDFTCEAYNIMGIGKSATIRIHVQDKPDFYLSMEPDGPIYEGSNISLSCKSYNKRTSPCPHSVNWLFDWSGIYISILETCDRAERPDASKLKKGSKTYLPCIELKKGFSILHLLWVDRTLVGEEFSFSGKNIHRRNIYTEKVKLVINYKPGPPIITYSPEIVNRGDILSLFCDSKHDMGHPAATSYRWYYRAIEIENVISSKMAIKSINLNNPALFSCRAVNTLGDGELKNVYIDIIDSSTNYSDPSINKFITHSTNSGSQKTVSVYPAEVNSEKLESVYISCRYGDDPISEFEEVVWIQNGTELTVEEINHLTVGRHENHSLFIPVFEEINVGIYNCKIINIEGVHISPDIKVGMLELPEVKIIVDRPEPTLNGEKQIFTLHCTAISGNPTYLSKVKWSVALKDIAETVDCDYKEAIDGVSDPTCEPGSQDTLHISSDDNTMFLEFGDYRCQGFNSYEWSDWSEPNYLNMPPPSAATVTSSSKHNPAKVFKGRKVLLHCILEDNDPIEYLEFNWYKDEQFVKNGSTEWSIMSMSVEDEGIYSCEAMNKVGGVGKRGSLTLLMIDRPDFYLSLEPQGILKEGDNVTFRCLRHNDSPFSSPKYPKWLTDNTNHQLKLKSPADCKTLKPLEHSEIPTQYIESEYQICAEKQPPALHFINIDRSLEGDYRCSIFRMGEHLESDNTALVINYKPGRPTLTYTPTEVHRGDILTLSCNGSENMGVPISTSYRWYKRSIEFDVMTDQIIIKTDALESPAFFSCRLVNSEGFGEFDHVLIDILDPLEDNTAI